MLKVDVEKIKRTHTQHLHPYKIRNRLLLEYKKSYAIFKSVDQRTKMSTIFYTSKRIPINHSELQKLRYT